ncbi:MAG: DUF4352 domain-containing protein [Bradymonadaceae bacterium]|nr:DUF4352 domain-containing protein [Lujinxingiaceae bacterium]
MTTPFGARIFYVLTVLALLAALPACEKPLIAAAGESVTVGGINFQVQEYSVRYLELSGEGNTYEYPRPVLVIPVSIKNSGEGDFVYNPTYNAQQMTEAATPLLYPDPGAEVDLATAQKAPINGVFLQKGVMKEQITERRTLKAGESINDVFLFEVPDAASTNLIFSLPPAMHRGELPVIFRMAFKPTKPQGPPVHEIGEAVTIGNVEFTVSAAETTFVKINDTAQGEGFSTEPVFKISYTITNNSSEALRYDPGHRELAGRRGAALFASNGAFSRVRFPATSSAQGQVERAASVDAGTSVKDFVMFEPPGKEVEAVMLELPAAVFEGNGLIRVNIPYQHKTPDKPKEMQKKAEN